MLLSQGDSVYRSYSLKSFLRNHITDTTAFYRSIYNTLRYPAVAREHGMEGIVDVLVINHSDSLFETYISEPRKHFFVKNLHESISNSRALWVGTDIPFLFKFSVKYKLVSQGKESQDSASSSDFEVMAYRIYEERGPDYVYNLNEVSYIPQIIGSPYFRNPKKIERFYIPIESIEQLLEEAARACCHKKMKFRKIQPPRPHSEWVSFKESKVSISLLFHPKGYIYDVRLSGPLSHKLDAVALKSVLKDVRFKPALVDTTPVYAILEFANE